MIGTFRKACFRPLIVVIAIASASSCATRGKMKAPRAGAEVSAEVYVAPDGSDDAAGTRASPVASLSRAIELAKGRGVATVLLRGGTYAIEKPVVIDPANVATPLMILSAPGERAVISGGRRISGWR